MSQASLIIFDSAESNGTRKPVSPDNPLPVTLAAGSAAVGTVVLGAGSASVGTVVLGAGSASVGTVTLASGSAAVALKPAATPGTGGLSTYYNTALNATKAAVVAVPLSIYGWQINNPNGAFSYVQMFNKLTANVTVGTTVPDFVIGIPANGSVTILNALGIDFSIGLVVAATTTFGGSTNPATQALPVAIFYK